MGGERVSELHLQLQALVKKEIALASGSSAGVWKLPAQSPRDGQVTSNHPQTSPPPTLGWGQARGLFLFQGH